MSTPYLHGKFVWFEHMSRDIAKASAFYDTLFGWHSQEVPMGPDRYPLIQHRGTGIGGYRLATGKAPTHWIAYLSVPDVDARFAAVAARGCRTMLAPTDFGPGRMAAVADPTGAAFALWKGRDGDPPDLPSQPGDWHWTELWTTDENKALDFYRAVFGFEADRMPMPGGASYAVLRMNDVPRAGLTAATGAQAHSMWLPYVAVADCDASAEQARSLGAEIVVQPTDIPEVGRFAVLADPLGAAVGVIRPQR